MWNQVRWSAPATTRTSRRKPRSPSSNTRVRASRPRAAVIRLVAVSRGGIVRTILLIILILLLLGALPTWPYSAGWGYYPSGGLGLVMLVVIVLILMGVI